MDRSQTLLKVKKNWQNLDNKCISLTTYLTSNTICENENVITECSAGKTETANKKLNICN